MPLHTDIKKRLAAERAAFRMMAEEEPADITPLPSFRMGGVSSAGDVQALLRSEMETRVEITQLEDLQKNTEEAEREIIAAKLDALRTHVQELQGTRLAMEKLQDDAKADAKAAKKKGEALKGGERSEWEEQAGCGRSWHTSLEQSKDVSIDDEAPDKISFEEAESFEVVGKTKKSAGIVKLQLKALMAVWTGSPVILNRIPRPQLRVDIPSVGTEIEDKSGLKFKCVPPLPTGLNLRDNGSIQGVPSYQGRSEHVITVMHEDYTGQAKASITLEVLPPRQSKHYLITIYGHVTLDSPPSRSPNQVGVPMQPSKLRE